MGIFLSGRDDDGVHFGSQMAVRVGDRLLVVKIGHIPHSPDNVADSELTADVNRKPLIVNDSNAIHSTGGLTDDVLALLHREEAALVLIDSHGHYDLVKNRQGSGKNVQMT